MSLSLSGHFAQAWLVPSSIRHVETACFIKGNSPMFSSFCLGPAWLGIWIQTLGNRREAGKAALSTCSLRIRSGKEKTGLVSLPTRLTATPWCHKCCPASSPAIRSGASRRGIKGIVDRLVSKVMNGEAGNQCQFKAGSFSIGRPP